MWKISKKVKSRRIPKLMRSVLIRKNSGRLIFLKTIAMMLVIMDHSIPHSLLHEIASLYWQRIAIPFFLIITGFNWAKSLEKHKDKPLRELYSWKGYFKKKLIRFFLPFGIIYALSIIFKILINLTEVPLMDVAYYDDPVLKIMLFLPVWGPGNWYIPVLFGFILIFPIMYKAFSRLPVVSLVVCFIIEYGWYTIIFILRVIWALADYAPIGVWNYYNTLTILRCTSFRALSAGGLGIWLSQNHKWNSLRNIFIYIYGILSGIYLFFYTFRDFRFTTNVFGTDFAFFIGDYSMLHFGWSAMLILIFLNIFPKEPAGKSYRFISLISKSTYHILMVQIFYFSVIYNLLLPMFGDTPIFASFGGEFYWAHYIWYYPFNLLFTFSLGILWYNLENKYVWERMKLADSRRYEHAKARGRIT